MSSVLSPDVMALLRELSSAAAQRAIDLSPIPKLRPATAQSTTTAILDGSGEPSVPVQNLLDDDLAAGDRVMVMLVPPHGAFVIGRITVAATQPEAVHVVGAASQPAFVAPWAWFGAGWVEPSYWIDVDGWVHLAGLLARGAAVTGSTIFTLPVGYRPAVDRVFSVNGGAVHQQITVAATGAVRWFQGAGAPGDVSLSGIRFYAGTFDQALTGANAADVGQIALNGFTTNAVAPSAGQMPIVHRRSDGLVRVEGNLASTTALPSIIGAMPPWAVRRFTAVHAAFAYDGAAAVKAARLDFAYDGRVIGRQNYVNVGSQFWLDGIGVWDTTAEAGWAQATLLNGWTHIAGDFGVVRYRKDSSGVVHMTGGATGGVLAAGTILCTLPVGFRPSARLIFGAMVSDTFQRIDVTVGGDVIIGAAWPAATYASFASVFFRAAG